MRNITLFVLMALVLAVAVTAKDRDWKLGRVLDSKSSSATFATGATSNTTSTGTATATTTGDGLSSTTLANGQAQHTTTTVVHHTTIRDTELMILGADYAYVIDDPVVTRGPVLHRALANRGHGCRFIIGDDINYAQEKAKLIVLDPDGKECTLDIVRQEKVQH